MDGNRCSVEELPKVLRSKDCPARLFVEGEAAAIDDALAVLPKSVNAEVLCRTVEGAEVQFTR